MSKEYEANLKERVEAYREQLADLRQENERLKVQVAGFDINVTQVNELNAKQAQELFALAASHKELVEKGKEFEIAFIAKGSDLVPFNIEAIRDVAFQRFQEALSRAEALLKERGLTSTTWPK